MGREGKAQRGVVGEVLKAPGGKGAPGAGGLHAPRPGIERKGEPAPVVPVAGAAGVDADEVPLDREADARPAIGPYPLGTMALGPVMERDPPLPRTRPNGRPPQRQENKRERNLQPCLHVYAPRSAAV